MRILLRQNCTRRLMVLKEVTMINFTSLYICVHCMRGLKAYSQQLIYNFLQSPTLYWVSSDPGRDSILHVKVTICADWFPKVLAC